MPNLNETPKIVDFENTLFPGQQANESGSRHLTGTELAEKLKRDLTINGQRIRAVTPGALPSGPSDQEAYMEVTAVGTWTYGGSPVGSNAEGFKTTFWWTGSAWVNNGSVRVTGQPGAPGENGANGKTAEVFNPTKTGGYSVGDTIYFPLIGKKRTYIVIANASTGESPSTNPAKFEEITSGIESTNEVAPANTEKVPTSMGVKSYAQDKDLFTSLLNQSVFETSPQISGYDFEGYSERQNGVYITTAGAIASDAINSRVILSIKVKKGDIVDYLTNGTDKGGTLYLQGENGFSKNFSTANTPNSGKIIIEQEGTLYMNSSTFSENLRLSKYKGVITNAYDLVGGIKMSASGVSSAVNSNRLAVINLDTGDILSVAAIVLSTEPVLIIENNTGYSTLGTSSSGSNPSYITYTAPSKCKVYINLVQSSDSNNIISVVRYGQRGKVIDRLFENKDHVNERLAILANVGDVDLDFLFYNGKIHKKKHYTSLNDYNIAVGGRSYWLEVDSGETVFYRVRNDFTLYNSVSVMFINELGEITTISRANASQIGMILQKGSFTAPSKGTVIMNSSSILEHTYLRKYKFKIHVNKVMHNRVLVDRDNSFCLELSGCADTRYEAKWRPINGIDSYYDLTGTTGSRGQTTVFEHFMELRWGSSSFDGKFYLNTSDLGSVRIYKHTPPETVRIMADGMRALIGNDVYSWTWGEDFTKSSSMNWERWRPRTGEKANGNNLKSNVTIDTVEKCLKIRIANERVNIQDEEGNDTGVLSSKLYTCGGVISRKKDFTYGYYECEFKAPETLGTHTSFWTTQAFIRSVETGMTCNEVDIMEFDSETDKFGRLYQNLHQWMPRVFATNGIAVTGQFTTRDKRGNPHPENIALDFHRIGALYTKEYIAIYFDGVLIRTWHYQGNYQNFKINPAEILFTTLCFSTMDLQGRTEDYSKCRYIKFFELQD